jgi:hypothetical protein
MPILLEKCLGVRFPAISGISSRDDAQGGSYDCQRVGEKGDLPGREGTADRCECATGGGLMSSQAYACMRQDEANASTRGVGCLEIYRGDAETQRTWVVLRSQRSGLR